MSRYMLGLANGRSGDSHNDLLVFFTSATTDRAERAIGICQTPGSGLWQLVHCDSGALSQV